MDFSVIQKAGITQREFATIVGVSRVTANMWSRGKMNPHRLIKHNVERCVARIGWLVETGQLPLTSIPRARRLGVLKGLIDDEPTTLAPVTNTQSAD